jgi:solute carrier family 45, member 1/2/4
MKINNNSLWFLYTQGPCRALLSDLSGGDARKTRMSYAGFSFFMAVGNVLGYAAGAYSKLYHIFPFTSTTACDAYCANLKSCFIISIALLMSLTVLALTLVRETPLSELQKSEITDDVTEESGGKGKSKLPFLGEIFAALKDLPRPMWLLLLVTCFNWIGWFPFILFDTDWTGREIYGGESGSNLYDRGVHMGALGLMLNSVVLGVTSVVVEHLGRRVGGVKNLWGGVNFLLAICLGMTVLVSKLADSTRHANGTPASGVKIGTLAIFSVMGIPLSVSFFCLQSLNNKAVNY